MAHDADTRGEAPSAPDGQVPPIHSAAITLFGSAFGGLLTIVGEVLAARLLEVQDYGLYATAMTVARVGEAISVFGLQLAIFHYIPVYRRQSQTALLIGTVYASALLPLVIGVIYLLSIGLMAPWLGSAVFNSAEVVIFIRLLSFAVPFMAVSEVLGAITRGFGFAKYYVMIRNLTPPVVFLTSISLMAVVGAASIWITGAVLAAYVLACAVGGFAVLQVAGRDLWVTRPVFDFSLYRYASGVMLNNVFYLVFAVTGLLAVGFYHGSGALGIYRACLQIVLPFEMIVLAFHAAMGPVYRVLAQENRLAELEEAYGMSIGWMAILHLPMGVALAWNRNDLLALLGPQFTAGGAALAILAVGFALCMCYGTGAYLLMLSGRTTLETKNAALGAAVNVIFAIVLVPRFGLEGAALSTVSGFVLVNALRIWEIRQFVQVRTFRPRFLRISAVSGGSATIIFAGLQFSGVFQGPDPISLGLRLVVMALLQAGVLWRFGLSHADKQAVARLIRSTVSASSTHHPA